MAAQFAVLSALLLVLASAAPAIAAPDLSWRTIQNDLVIPWDVAFTPGGRMLVTERPGRVRVYADGSRNARLLSVRTLKKVRAEGEAGVMGIATTRRNNRTFVFVCASRQDEGKWRNQVLRYVLRRGELDFDRYVLRRGIRASSIHNGCAVEIGPDGKLWVGTGDADRPVRAQRRRSLNGKVLRMNLDGSVPASNPFNSKVFTLGHRNVQGIAFHPTKKWAYAVEHGPDRDDEINRLRPGENYGWPCFTGDDRPYATGYDICRSPSAYRSPAWASGSPTLATSGAAFASGPRWDTWRNDLFVSTLKESDVRRFDLSRRGRRAYARSVLLDGRYGRLRAAVASRSGNALYLTTSNGSNDRVVRLRAR